LNDFPFIRFYNPSSANDGVSAKLAAQIQKDLEAYKEMDSSFAATSDFKRPVLIIVDRSLDMMAPFLHEFTYQAMMRDLLAPDRIGAAYKFLI
jgi:syntaxin-binding protein 1